MNQFGLKTPFKARTVRREIPPLFSLSRSQFFSERTFTGVPSVSVGSIRYSGIDFISSSDANRPSLSGSGLSFTSTQNMYTTNSSLVALLNSNMNFNLHMTVTIVNSAVGAFLTWSTIGQTTNFFYLATDGAGDIRVYYRNLPGNIYTVDVVSGLTLNVEHDITVGFRGTSLAIWTNGIYRGLVSDIYGGLPLTAFDRFCIGSRAVGALATPSIALPMPGTIRRFEITR